MTSVVLERIADGVFVSLLLRGLLFFVHGDATPVRLARYGANVMFAVFFGGFLFLLFAAWRHDGAVALVRGRWAGSLLRSASAPRPSWTASWGP